MASPPNRVDAVRQELSEASGIRKRTSLIPNQSGTSISIRVTLPHDALAAAGVDPDDPGEIDQWWFPEDDILVFDLESDHDD
jgi:hypothetical protein